MKSLKRGEQGAVNYRARRLRGGVINSRPAARYIYRRRTTVPRYIMAGILPPLPLGCLPPDIWRGATIE